ncbi:IS3 family transposase [Streptomyces incanus]|uniref:IS3 family transposase n=1 Tax=Streptomyces incanus TaxID=887453 RepID=A0ABW0XVF1_9ACTN
MDTAARCRFIDAEKASGDNRAGHSVALLCRARGVLRSASSAHQTAASARRAARRAEERLVDAIRVLHAGPRGACGAPRIHAALRRAVNGKEVERLMRKQRIVGITRRRRRGLTRQAKRAVFAADLTGRDFTAPAPGCGWSVT